MLNAMGNIKQYIYPVSGKDIIAATMHKTPTFYQLPFFLSDLYTKSPDKIPTHYTIGDTIEILKSLDIKGEQDKRKIHARIGNLSNGILHCSSGWTNH